jgi:hypothetical protein
LERGKLHGEDVSFRRQRQRDLGIAKSADIDVSCENYQENVKDWGHNGEPRAKGQVQPRDIYIPEEHEDNWR